MKRQMIVPWSMSAIRGGVTLGVIGLATACQNVSVNEVELDPPMGEDVVDPFPIDRGDESVITPGSYKGLPLRLVEAGEPRVEAVDGIIGLVCIGMSNSSQECDTFKTRVEETWAGEINSSVRVINCARGGHAIEKWIDSEYDRNLWERCINTLLPQAGVRVDQVRVLYHKAANQFTTAEDGSALPFYPETDSDYWAFYDNLTSFAERVPIWFPSVVAVYTSSRIYGGYANNQDRRGEPLSYEEGLALNEWLDAYPAMPGVWYGWGPYLWAPACADGFNASGTCYNREDFRDDGVHPSDAGREKVAGLIHERLREHDWYGR